MSLNKMFDEFNELYGLSRKDIDHNLPVMHDLIEDERQELAEEIFDVQDGYHPNYQDVIKESIDIIYITCQQLRERGVDVDAALTEVHRSNMSKTVSIRDIDKEYLHAKARYPEAEIVHTGKYQVLKCADTGKVIKPTTYSPAVITPEMCGGE